MRSIEAILDTRVTRRQAIRGAGVLVLSGTAAAVLAACGDETPSASERPAGTPGWWRAVAAKSTAPAVPTEAPAAATAGARPDASPATATVSATEAPKSTVTAEKIGYDVFRPRESWNLEALRIAEVPTYESMLKSHGLTPDDIQELRQTTESWEPGRHVVELTKENYGKKTIPLLEGYVYSVALQDGSVEILWGGDPKVLTADILWGFTARWVPEYEGKGYGEGGWLSFADPREFVVREYRFGRYMRSPDMQEVRTDVPYFGRFGPYYTGTGNLDTQGWVPPSLDSTVPRNHLDAAAMLGGLANEKEWAFGEKASGGFLNCSWTYSKKVPGSADYCPIGDPCWQTVYVPEGRGYVEIWLSKGTTGPDGSPVTSDGPYRFFAKHRPILADGFHGVDELSYHADPSR